MVDSVTVDSANREDKIRTMLLDGQFCFKKPVTAHVPFPYHWVPGALRMKLARLLARSTVRAVRADLHRQPSSYADNGTDLLAALGFPAASGEAVWSWPDGKKCALVLSHDVDTRGQERGIDLLRQVAADNGVPSTFSFVGECIASYRDKIAQLRADGCAIVLHDVKHDNNIAFLKEDQIVMRLRSAAGAMRELNIRGFRSPSWYTSRALWSALERAGFSYDMSVLDTWAFFDSARNYGVGSFFPFVANGLVLLPNTIPFEQFLRFGYRTEDALRFWQPKIDFIARAGGLIMFNAHPDRWFSGTPKGARSLSSCVEYIRRTHDPVCLTADQAADHTLKECGRGALVDLGGSPQLRLPRHSAGFLAGSSHKCESNPCLVSPGVFLSRKPILQG